MKVKIIYMTILVLISGLVSFTFTVIPSSAGSGSKLKLVKCQTEYWEDGIGHAKQNNEMAYNLYTDYGKYSVSEVADKKAMDAVWKFKTSKCKNGKMLKGVGKSFIVALPREDCPNFFKKHGHPCK